MTDIINSYGYLGIFFLIFVENMFPPIPSEVVLLFGGALTVGTMLKIPGVIIAATIGSVIGACALYTLGRVLKIERLKIFFSGKLGRLLHFNGDDVQKASDWFAKYQTKAVLICRCVPIIRSLISIPAGCNEMNIPNFLLLTTIGSAVWNTVLVCIGAALGVAWESALPYLSQYSHVILILCVIIFVGFVAYLFLRPKKEKDTETEK